MPKTYYYKSKYRIDKVNKLHFEDIDCRFEIIMDIYEEFSDDYMKKLSPKENYVFIY